MISRRNSQVGKDAGNLQLPELPTCYAFASDKFLYTYSLGQFTSPIILNR